MTEEEKRLQEEQQRNAEMMDRAIAYARSVGYGVEGQQAPATQPEQPVTPDYGLRNDGTKKGKGWLGEIRLPNGNVATEYSVGVGFDGKETEIPTLVPTLTQEEIAQMRDDIIPNNKPVPEGIMNKAIEHARSRMQAGQSVWADETPAVTGTQPQPAPATTPTTQPIPTAKNTDEAYRNLISATQEAGNNLTAAKVAQTQSDLDFYQQQDAERRKADAEAWQQVLNGQKDLLQYWVDRDNEAKAEAKRAEEEDRMKTEMENRRAGLVGAGEVAASLINLFSVGNLHATNQVYKDHMQDWMKKADADRKYRQLRIDQLRERQRAIGDKQAALRYANTEANYNQYRERAKEEAQRAADMQKLRSAIPVIEAAGKAETTATAGKLEVDRNKAVTDEKLTRASIAARASRGGGRTDSDLRIVTFPAFGDANNGGLPSETYQVRSKDIVINAKTHLNQLSADERSEVKAILNDPEKDMEEKADAILPFLTENKAFRQAIQIASVGHLVNGRVADNKRKKGPDALLGDDEDPTK